jgi:hypothetical protein
MLHLHEDPRLLKPEPVRGSENLDATIRTGLGHSRLVSHRPENGRDDLRYLPFIQSSKTILKAHR